MIYGWGWGHKPNITVSRKDQLWKVKGILILPYASLKQLETIFKATDFHWAKYFLICYIIKLFDSGGSSEKMKRTNSIIMSIFKG